MKKKVVSYVKTHKILSLVIVGIILIGSYPVYKKINSVSAASSYVISTVEKGSIIATVSGSGQVSASNQVDIKSKGTGDVLSVLVKNGQEVKTGQILAQLNARDALQTVRDAEDGLESARLSLEKILKPTDALSLMQSENALTQAEESKQDAEDDLKKAYDDGFNTTANAFLDLPSVISGLRDILYSTNYSANQDNKSYYSDSVKNYDYRVENYRDDAANAYQIARAAYDRNFTDYKTISRFSDTTVMENMIKQTYETTKKIAEAVKITNNFIQFYQDKLTERNAQVPTLSNTHLSSLNSYTGKTNTHLGSLLNITQSIKNYKDTIVSSERTIAEKTQSLADLKSGADVLDVRTQQLNVKQKQNSLLDAQMKLSDYSIRAPFDGVIAAVSIKKGDSLSSGTAAFTFITKQKLAEISLNEVDVAKVKIGQKVNITFDAIDGLSISGQVSDMDLIGTATQGVVNYNIKISFDTQDDRVKTGMSLSVAIITDMKQDVLVVPSSAVKTQNGMSYVEILSGATSVTDSQGIISDEVPIRQLVEIGLTDDTNTEILSGLKEGDMIVVKTITNAAGKTTQAPSLLQSVGASRSGSGVGAAGRALR